MSVKLSIYMQIHSNIVYSFIIFTINDPRVIKFMEKRQYSQKHQQQQKNQSFDRRTSLKKLFQTFRIFFFIVYEYNTKFCMCCYLNRGLSLFNLAKRLLLQSTFIARCFAMDLIAAFMEANCRQKLD